MFFWDGDGRCEELELAEADVDQVLAWCGQHAAGRTYSLWVTVSTADGLGHVRLLGIDPPAPAGTWPHCASDS